MSGPTPRSAALLKSLDNEGRAQQQQLANNMMRYEDPTAALLDGVLPMRKGAGPSLEPVSRSSALAKGGQEEEEEDEEDGEDVAGVGPQFALEDEDEEQGVGELEEEQVRIRAAPMPVGGGGGKRGGQLESLSIAR